MAKDYSKILKAGVRDAVIAIEDSSGNARTDEVGIFPFAVVGLLGEDNLKVTASRSAITEAGGQEIQKFDVEAKISGLETDAVEFSGVLEKLAGNSNNASLYLFGDSVSHKIRNLGMIAEKDVDVSTKGKSLSAISVRAGKNDLTDIEVGKSATFYLTHKAYQYLQVARKSRRADLVMELPAYLGSLNQVAKLFDSSKYRIVGGLYNAPTWGVAPDANFAKLSFDGVNDYADMGNVMNDDGVSDFILEAWIKPLGANGAKLNLVAKKSALQNTTAGYGLVRDTSNAIYFDFADGTNRVTFGSAGGAVLINTWYHIAVAIDRDGNGRMYINGVAVGSPTAVSSVLNATNALSFFIGRDGSGSYSSFEFAGLRMYNFGAGGLPANVATIISDNFNAERSILGV